MLWTDPFGRFAELVRTLNGHPLDAIHLFRGEWLYSPDGPPWDYVPVWIGITTPPATLLLALAGTLALAWGGLRQPRDILRNGPSRFGLLLAALPVVTAVAVVVLESNVYGTWRHLFFLYASLAPLAITGIHWFTSSVHGRWPKAGAYTLLGAAMATVIVSTARIHPHQNNYFNFLVDRTAPERLQSRYDVSEWQHGLVLEMLTAIPDTRPPASLSLSWYAGSRLLPREKLERFRLTRDFRSGERNVLILPDPRACSLASASPSATVRAVRIYASALHCVVEPVAWFGDLRRQALAAEPLVRAVYDIHRDGRLLIYLRDGCPREDVEGGARFFLHVVPLNAGDRLPGRREYGFDNFDRPLRHGSARIDGDCVAVFVLPNYPIASIRTGQYDDTGRLWTAEFPLPGGE